MAGEYLYQKPKIMDWIKEIKAIQEKIEYLETQEKSLFLSPLARQQFRSECEKIFQKITSQVLKITKRVLDKNSKSENVFSLYLNNVARVEFKIFKKDHISLLEDDPICWDLCIKREAYFAYKKVFDGYSLKLFDLAIKEIIRINQILDRY